MVSDSDRNAVKRYLAQEHELRLPQSCTSETRIKMPQIDKTMKQILSHPAQAIGLNFTAATVGNVLNPDITPPQPSHSGRSAAIYSYVLWQYPKF